MRWSQVVERLYKAKHPTGTLVKLERFESDLQIENELYIAEAGYANYENGMSRIVTDPDGRQRLPYAICIDDPKRQALFDVRSNDLVIDVKRANDWMDADIWRIHTVNTEGEVIVEHCYHLRSMEDIKYIPQQLRTAVRVSYEKSKCFHCTTPSYVLLSPKWWQLGYKVRMMPGQ